MIKITNTHYNINGNKYDRVTSILGYFTPKPLVDWQLKNGKEAKQVSKTAKAIGTRVHNLSLEYDKKMSYRLTPNDSPSIGNCMRAYKEFKNIEKPTYIESEYMVFSDKLGIAGTMDRKLVTKEVIDLKTSNKIRLSYWIQLAIYNYLDNESSDTLSVVRLDKFSGIYEYKSVPYSKDLVSIFLGLLDYYRFLNCNIKDKEEYDGNTVTYPEITNRLGLQEAKDCNSWKSWYREV